MSTNMEFAIFLIVVGLHGVMSEVICDNPFDEVEDADGTVYCMKAPVVEASWIEGQAWCNWHYSTLVLISDSKMQDAFEDYISNLNRTNNDFWLGGTDVYSPHTWNFLSPKGAQEVDEYNDWGVGFPRAYGNKNCMFMTTNARAEGTWRNAACNEKKQFVCFYYQYY